MSKLEVDGQPVPANVPYPIVRIPKAGVLRMEVCTRSWVNLMVHYTGSGAKVCPGEDKCTACLSGILQQWQGYVMATPIDKRQFFIVPLTQLAAYMLKQQVWRKQSLWGAKVVLTRTGPRANGPVEASIWGWSDDTPFTSIDRLLWAVSTIHRLHKHNESTLEVGE